MINRFWASVWSVALYLLAVGLLQYIVRDVITLFGLIRNPEVLLAARVIVLLVPLVATITYIDWRWGWKGDSIGLSTRSSAAGWALAGIALGLVAAAITLLITGRGLPEALPPVSLATAMDLILILLVSLSVELVFRGVVVSRYQVDLSRREMLLAASLTPFGWILLQMLFGARDLSPEIGGWGTAAMSVAFTLIFLRTDSVWFTAGLRFGMVGSLALVGVRSASLERGALIIWGVVAIALLALEWQQLQGVPRRMPPGRTSRRTAGRTIRGPWGPH